MHKSVGHLFRLLLLFGIVGTGSIARAAGPAATEKSLLGVRILANYRDVLRKYGTPTRVYRFWEPVAFERSVDSRGTPTGGIRRLGPYVTLASLSGGGGGGMSGGGSSSKSSGSSLASSSGSGGGGAGATENIFYLDFAGKATRLLEYGSQGSKKDDVADELYTFDASSGFVWSYYFPKQQLVYVFSFNNAKRVESIVERGWIQGKPTQRGIRIGSTVKDIYAAYGWPETVQEQGGGVVMNYSHKYHVQLALIASRVVGITVTIGEDRPVHYIDPSNLQPTSSGGAGMDGSGSGSGGSGP